MGVVSGSKNKVIFCEGVPPDKGYSLDIQLLTRLLKTLPEENVTTVPATSKFNFTAFAEGYFAQNQNNSPKYLFFRDRDFDLQPTPEVRLIELKKMWLTHRTCIENYLLDANLIHQYWTEKYQEKRENPISKWGHKNSPGIEAVTKWIEESARSLKDYQAVRWALGDLLLSSQARKQLKTTWTGESGKLPSSLTLKDCQNQAIALIEQYREAIEIVTIEKFEESLAKYQQQFNQDEFWTQKQYLIGFQGKDIQKAMQKQKNDYINLEDFFKWAIAHLDLDQHPDLIELQNKIKDL